MGISDAACGLPHPAKVSTHSHLRTLPLLKVSLSFKVSDGKWFEAWSDCIVQIPCCFFFSTLSLSSSKVGIREPLGNSNKKMRGDNGLNDEKTSVFTCEMLYVVNLFITDVWF